jgi:separase
MPDDCGTKSRMQFLAQLEAILQKAILTTKDNRVTRFETNPQILETFLSLQKSASDEDLEDLLHFVVDSYQFAGVHVACDEIDVDQVSS